MLRSQDIYLRLLVNLFLKKIINLFFIVRSLYVLPPFLMLLVNLYRLLAGQTSSTFNRVVLKGLYLKLCYQENKTTILVGTVMDDVRVQEVPKLKVSSLHMSHILKTRSKIFTFNQLALDSCKGCGTILFSDPWKGLEVYRHFNRPCEPHTGQKSECTRGQLAHRGYKN
ncbi:unnamed protein product [Nyctereutes procyonoides]|uniref:(raccoon dog) hypothetical protein n=1 Tax=Nyctereutes procyonoides TaxID=34880 RepID=A0A811ZFS3_NYCPR|nr:unnamed protein product [Nyctereutes procyonoides]